MIAYRPLHADPETGAHEETHERIPDGQGHVGHGFWTVKVLDARYGRGCSNRDDQDTVRGRHERLVFRVTEMVFFVRSIGPDFKKAFFAPVVVRPLPLRAQQGQKDPPQHRFGGQELYKKTGILFFHDRNIFPEIKIKDVKVIGQQGPVREKTDPMIGRGRAPEVHPENDKHQIERKRIRPAAIMPVKYGDILQKRPHPHLSLPETLLFDTSHDNGTAPFLYDTGDARCGFLDLVLLSRNIILAIRANLLNVLTGRHPSQDNVSEPSPAKKNDQDQQEEPYQSPQKALPPEQHHKIFSLSYRTPSLPAVGRRRETLALLTIPTSPLGRRPVIIRYLSYFKKCGNVPF